MTASMVILTEEPSARVVIDAVCRIAVSERVQVLEHAGKGDLERSVTRKINGWTSPQKPKFIVTRDLDAASRERVKSKLIDLVPLHARARTKIRVVVPELEVWYLGDPEALEEVGLVSKAAAARLRSAAKYRNLCAIKEAKAEFKKLVGPIGQIAAAELIGPAMQIERNRSHNFQAFIDAVRWASNFE